MVKLAGIPARVALKPNALYLKKKEKLCYNTNMLEGEQHNIPSPERMNTKFDPEDPLATINYCLHKLTGAVPIFFTRRDRQNIENFLQNKSIPFFTLQSGERL